MAAGEKVWPEKSQCSLSGPPQCVIRQCFIFEQHCLIDSRLLFPVVLSGGATDVDGAGAPCVVGRLWDARGSEGKLLQSHTK